MSDDGEGRESKQSHIAERVVGSRWRLDVKVLEAN
jgi:hypothetical protein